MISRFTRGLAVLLALGLVLPVACKRQTSDGEKGAKKGKAPFPGKRGKRSRFPRQSIPKLSAAERKIVLAEVNGQQITKGEFHDRIHRQSVFNRRRYTTLKRKKQFLERNFVLPAIEFAEAKRRKLESDSYVQRTLKHLIYAKMLRALRKEFRINPPTEQEMQAYYAKHKDEYNTPELVRASQIVVATQAEAQKALGEIKNKNRLEYRRILRKYIQAAKGKSKSGDLRFFDRGGKVRGHPGAAGAVVPKEIATAVWKLQKPRDTAGPLRTKAGWHVLYFTGRRRARTRDFRQARHHVKKRLMRERYQQKKTEFVKKLRAEFKVKMTPKAELDRRLGLVKVDFATRVPMRTRRIRPTRMK